MQVFNIFFNTLGLMKNIFYPFIVGTFLECEILNFLLALDMNPCVYMLLRVSFQDQIFFYSIIT